MELITKDYWVTEYNHCEEVTKNLEKPEKVLIYDNTLREGNQTPGVIMRKDEQLAVAQALDDLGVDFIECFPAVSADDEALVTEMTSNNMLKHAKVSCLVRPKTRDMDYAIKCGAQHIFLEGPSNMNSARGMGYSSVQEIMDSFVETLKTAKANGMTVTACPWDAGKAPIEDLERWVKTLVEAGADDVCLADTFAYFMPWTTMYLIRKFREWSEDKAIISCHFHNDYGVSTASTLAAVAAGARCVQVSMNNLGERAGNTPLDEVAVNLALNMGIETNIDLKKLYPTSRLIEKITKFPIPAKKPLLGEECEWQGSGIVVDFLQKLHAEEPGKEFCMLPMNPELVGAPPYKIVYGKGCGKNMVVRFLAENGINATDEQAKAVVNAIKNRSMLTKSLVSEDEVKLIARNICK